MVKSYYSPQDRSDNLIMHRYETIKYIAQINDILPDLHNACYLPKKDHREVYHQIKLHEDSCCITAFATHKGVYQYKWLIYGVNSAFETFQKQLLVTKKIIFLRSCTIVTWTTPDMLNFWHHFIKDFSTIAAPLRYLTKKNVPFQWTKQHQQAFNTLQHALCSSETLALCNLNADTCLTV